MCTKSKPNKRSEICLKRWSLYAFKLTLEWLVWDEKMIQTQTDPMAKSAAHLWTKPVAVVSCDVYYGMRPSICLQCFSNLFTVACRQTSEVTSDAPLCCLVIFFLLSVCTFDVPEEYLHTFIQTNQKGNTFNDPYGQPVK